MMIRRYKPLHIFFPFLLQLILLIIFSWRDPSQVAIISWIGLICAVLLRFTSHSKSLKTAIKIILSCFGTFLIFTSNWSFSSIEMGTQILLFLCSLKLFELDHHRDSVTYIAMSHLLFLAELLQKDQLYILPLIFVIVMSGHWYLARSRGIKSSLNRPLLKLGVASLAITLLLFLFFPRIQFVGLKWFSTLQMGLTGHSEKLRPGEIAELINNPEIVFRVNLEKEVPLDQLYWKGAVLHLTDGFNWEKGRFRGSNRIYGQVINRYQVDFETSYQGDIFTLDGTSHISLNRFSNAIRSSEEDWMVITAQPKKLHFEAQRSNFTDSPIHFKSIQKLLQFPLDKIDQSVKKALEEIMLNYPIKSPSADEKVAATIEYFKIKQYKYSLKPGIIDSLGDFLNKKRSGFCGHYASAMASLLRLQNVPTRVITGYQGGQYNSMGDYYIVREQDAHAWNEYWNGSVWKRVDLTEILAPARIKIGSSIYIDEEGNFSATQSKQTNLSFFSKLKFFSDLAYYRINTRFSNYDAEEQRKILRSITQLNRDQVLQVSTRLLLFFTIIIPTILLIYLLRKKDQRPWRLLCQKLQNMGHTLPPSTTPNQLAKMSNNPDFIQLMGEIEEYTYYHPDKVKHKEITRRIKKIKSPF